MSNKKLTGTLIPKDNKKAKMHATFYSDKPIGSGGDSEIFDEYIDATDQQRNTALANVSNQTANSTTGKMGYKVLDPTKTFASQVTAENTIYEIRDVFDLNNGSVTIPSGCTLKFEGGILKNATIVFDTTLIDTKGNKCVFTNCSISGTLSNDVAKIDWFVSVKTSDCKYILQSLINSGVSVIEFTSSEYYITPYITLRANLKMLSSCKSTIYTDSIEYYGSLFRFNDDTTNIDNFEVSGLVFEQRATQYTELSSSQVGRLLFAIYSPSNNISFTNCEFKFNGTNAVGINDASIENVIVEDCLFEFDRATVQSNPNYDSSSLYILSKKHIVSSNIFNSIVSSETINKTEKYVDGAVETHGIEGIISNNVFSNVKTCINVSNDGGLQDTAYGRTVVGNVADECNNFVRLWAGLTASPMKNIVISSNIITNVNNNAINSVYAAGSVGGKIKDIVISGNYFSGKSFDFDGSDLNANLPYYTTKSAIYFYSIDSIDNVTIKGNVFNEFPCGIVKLGYYRISSSLQTEKQTITACDNIIKHPFNCSISYSYSTMDAFSLFSCGNNSEVDLYNNIIELLDDCTIAPIFAVCKTNSKMKLIGNEFPYIESKIVIKDNTSEIVNDNPIARKTPQTYIKDTIDVAIIGDITTYRGELKYCTSAGISSDITLSNAQLNIENGIAFLTCDGIEDIKVGYILKFSINGQSFNNEFVSSIVNNRIYTSSFNTIKSTAGIDDNQSYSISITVGKAGWQDINIGITGDITYVPYLPKGGMYFSTGVNRPIWKSSGGNPLDAFGRAYKSYVGTTRPTNCSKGHMFFDETLGKYIFWNGTNWVNLDGTALS